MFSSEGPVGGIIPFAVVLNYRQREFIFFNGSWSVLYRVDLTNRIVVLYNLL